jgi:hypothetical protein
LLSPSIALNTSGLLIVACQKSAPVGGACCGTAIFKKLTKTILFPNKSFLKLTD